VFYLFYKKTIISILIVSIVASAAIGYINFKAPYAKNINLRIVTVVGSVDIKYKNPQAWTEFGYKDGNFYYFEQYWQNQIGKTFSYAGITATLVFISIELDKHTPSYDHLLFTVKLQPV
jgi:hypothetical protein